MSDDTINPLYIWRVLQYYYQTGVTILLQKNTTSLRSLEFSKYKSLEIPIPSKEMQTIIIDKLKNEQQILSGNKGYDAAVTAIEMANLLKML